MRCPTCGFDLPPVTELLAQTETGTQCPKCWVMLRRLSEPLETQEGEEEELPVYFPRLAG